MPNEDDIKQTVYLSDTNGEPNVVGRKQTRIELRALKDAYKLNIDPEIPNTGSVVPDTKLFRVTCYCTAESYDLKNLYKHLKKSSIVKGVSMYFGECLYCSFHFNEKNKSHYDCFFHDYGVVVCWGMDERHESDVIKLLSKFESKPYDLAEVEIEFFKYGLTENPFIINDVIYLNSEAHTNKMVISIAVAQSVKLDYFENLVDSTIESVKNLPEEVEKYGRVSKTRKDLLRVMGKLHSLRFSLNLGSNILDHPEFVWDYPAFSSLYETCRKYLEIKSRSDILNKRLDVIHGILEILSENITTSNSERLEMVMIAMISVNVIIGIVQIIVLCCKLG